MIYISASIGVVILLLLIDNRKGKPVSIETIEVTEPGSDEIPMVSEIQIPSVNSDEVNLLSGVEDTIETTKVPITPKAPITTRVVEGEQIEITHTYNLKTNKNIAINIVFG